MSSDLLRELRSRVDAAVKPHVDIYGPESPVVKMALRILAEAEDIERLLAEKRLSTIEAAERTGWSVETLQNYARRKLAGDDLPTEWADMDVVLISGNYAFDVATIPPKPKR